MTYKGVVKGNTVILLGEGVHLPNGTVVVVTVEQATQGEGEDVTREELSERCALITRMREFGQKLAGRNVSLGDLILEWRKRWAVHSGPLTVSSTTL